MTQASKRHPDLRVPFSWIGEVHDEENGLDLVWIYEYFIISSCVCRENLVK